MEARFWEEAGEGRVRCRLCRHECLIAAGRRGLCGVRENQGGRLLTLVYGRVIAENVDPIEKKPFFHVLPGSRSYSVATVGCNFRCLHCQNSDISQWQERRAIPGTRRTPAELVENALAAGCASIAYTYTEPTIFLEYAWDTMRLARSAGLANLFVTNGYTGHDALTAVAPWLDAANVDLKGFSERFYREVVGARLAGVLETLRLYHRLGTWLELTTLIIPGLNDDPVELREIARFIRDELGADTPWHVSAFHPSYRLLDRPATPATTLRCARAIGLEEGLRHVYTGNIPGETGEHTFCPGCGTTVIERHGYRLGGVRLKVGGRCAACDQPLAGRWEPGGTQGAGSEAAGDA